MERPIQTQTAPDQSGCPSVLIEGNPAVVLGLTSGGEEIPAALPHVLVEGQPVAVVSLQHCGAATVLGG